MPAKPMDGRESAEAKSRDRLNAFALASPPGPCHPRIPTQMTHEMKLYYVYAIRCFDGTFYVGVTNDVDRRF